MLQQKIKFLKPTLFGGVTDSYVSSEGLKRLGHVKSPDEKQQKKDFKSSQMSFPQRLANV